MADKHLKQGDLGMIDSSERVDRGLIDSLERVERWAERLLRESGIEGNRHV